MHSSAKKVAGLISTVMVPEVRGSKHPSEKRKNTDCNVTNYFSILCLQRCVYLVLIPYLLHAKIYTKLLVLESLYLASYYIRLYTYSRKCDNFLLELFVF